MIRQAQSSDLDECLRIQSLAHLPQHLEGAQTFEAYLKGGASWVLQGPTGLLGYCLCAPWDGQQMPCLGNLGPNPGEALWLHDLALDPQAQGQGWAKQLLMQALADSKIIGAVALSHVLPWWLAQGFYIVPGAVDPQYGTGASPIRREAPQH